MKGLKIKSIKKINYSGNVHNISVKDDETYFANGMLVHNCRSVLVPILIGENDQAGFFNNYKENMEPFGTGVSKEATKPAVGFGG